MESPTFSEDGNSSRPRIQQSRQIWIGIGGISRVSRATERHNRCRFQCHVFRTLEKFYIFWIRAGITALNIANA